MRPNRGFLQVIWSTTGTQPFLYLFLVWLFDKISKSLCDQHGETISSVKVGKLSGCHRAWLASFLCLTFSCRLLCLSWFRFPPSGYNTVVRIPAGATNIDIKQVSYSGKPEDDNYLGECTCVGSDQLQAGQSETRSKMEAVPSWEVFIAAPRVFILQVNAIIP